MKVGGWWIILEFYILLIIVKFCSAVEWLLFVFGSSLCSDMRSTCWWMTCQMLSKFLTVCLLTSLPFCHVELLQPMQLSREFGHLWKIVFSTLLVRDRRPFTYHLISLFSMLRIFAVLSTIICSKWQNFVYNLVLLLYNWYALRDVCQCALAAHQPIWRVMFVQWFLSMAGCRLLWLLFVFST